MATHEEHVAGVLTALNTSDKVAYTPDALPDVLPPFYIEVSLSRRYGGVRRGGSVSPDGRLMRILTRAVAQTEPQARLMFDRAAGLEDTVLVIAGAHSTPVEFETENPVAPDHGWYSGVSSWTYLL